MSNTPKPYLVRIDRGFYGCSTFISPVFLNYETESEARKAYSVEMQKQKDEMVKTPGNPLCIMQLIDMMDNNKVLVSESFDKNGAANFTQNTASKPAWLNGIEFPKGHNEWGNIGVCCASKPFK